MLVKNPLNGNARLNCSGGHIAQPLENILCHDKKSKVQRPYLPLDAKIKGTNLL